ncbi:hypothetical protein HAQ00_08250 [Acidithiobacillus caldus ATCC 51756]|nr:hypothetical protein [Acidithiobacillus caldus]MBU2735719.1 hypothetical protein [Acidithiobacillus caldus ATCC 51756]MBU2744698.1 hypothetical protein [Acidithiobacillus caldus]MBU2763973.1 hypothetical protein [Acidithiobacillus caldus]MBU2769831.1 hypothetical protein [Acidithiobacillus caldus]
MWDMVWNSAGLFLRGKLFKDTRKVLLLLLANIVLAAILTVAVYVATSSFALACIIAGVISGALQPLLFAKLKYA